MIREWWINVYDNGYGGRVNSSRHYTYGSAVTEGFRGLAAPGAQLLYRIHVRVKR